ncbi:hypothetical protein SAMN06298212_1281 [Ruaniaceae bacterium KH17]|nr:hypothetical protein SAMN06298212_1281 [Ruaniaceae bacterium KH17]
MARMTWDALPPPLRTQIGGALDSPVTTTESQQEGWSPGSADRVRAASGRRAFVKALARSHNPFGFELHTREAGNMALLPSSVRAPQLIETIHYADSDDWIALVLEDVDGDHPGGAAEATHAPAVLDALMTLRSDPGTANQFPPLAHTYRSSYAVWERLLSVGLPEALPAEVLADAHRCAAAATGVGAVLTGGDLVHGDCRADNLLIDAAGAVWLIDWPWAARGPRWFDGLTYLLDTQFRGTGVDADSLIESHPLFAESTPERIDTVLAWIAGVHIENSTRPAPPNMPGLRDFQRRQGIAAAHWFHSRQNA